MIVLALRDRLRRPSGKPAAALPARDALLEAQVDLLERQVEDYQQLLGHLTDVAAQARSGSMIQRGRALELIAQAARLGSQGDPLLTKGASS